MVTEALPCDAPLGATAPAVGALPGTILEGTCAYELLVGAAASLGG